MTTPSPSFLERSLDTLDLPTRVAGWASRCGIETLGQLVRWHPSDLAKERNMGRTSIAKLHAIIRAECGAEWEELWRLARAADPREEDVDLADVDWDSLAEELPEWLLGARLESLGLPKRMLGYAEREGLTTVGELVRRSRVELAAAKNLARGSIEATRSTLVQCAVEGPSAEPRPSTWDALSSSLPDWLLATPLAHLELPARMRVFVEREGLATVADLVRVPRSMLSRAPNLGRGSIGDTRTLLLETLTSRPRTIAEYDSFWALWLQRLGGLSPVDRLVLTQRSAISGDSRTLLEIGDMLGVSRERVRQIESRAIRTVARGSWVSEVCARIHAVLEGGALWLDALDAKDAWFAPIGEDRREAFAFFLERIADGALCVAPIDGRDAVLVCSGAEADAGWERAMAALRALLCPADEEEVARAIASSVPESAPGLARLVSQAVDERIHRDEHGRMVAFGTTRGAEVIAFLRRCAAPVTIHEVYAGLGQRVRFPPEVFYFERGRVGLEQHFPDYTKWARRLIPICVRILENDPRQWRVPDLLEAAREEALLPEWFGHWNLAEILRRSPEVRYLGRLRVTVAGDHDEERLHFAELAQRILLEAGAPLTVDELHRRILRETTISPFSFRLMVIHAPFVQVDDERIGLLARDVPGGSDALSHFGDSLAAELERAQKGLSTAGLAAFTTRLSDAHARWTIPMARAVARSDARFQLSRGGAVGLADWDDVRVPTRAEVVRTCVEEHGGRAPVSAVLARLEARHGARVDRRQLGALAFSAGVRLRGGELVLPEARSASPPGSVEGLPAESRAVFEPLVELPLAADADLLRALDAHVEMFVRAEAEGAPVDAAEASFLRERCRALLARSSGMHERARRLAQAAVRYFLLRDDAESDLSAGGLDDDDAVLGAIELHFTRMNIS